jgi:tetratricopeptide (TPR) repeat protein
MLLGILAAGAYLGTRAFAASVVRNRVGVAASWYREGDRALRAGQYDAAVNAYRKATVNDHSRQLYTESLARALELAGRTAEARQLLLQLRESAPENPQVNLELARLAAREADLNASLRYYHNALYGIWTGDNIDERQREVRAELINFLIAQHARDQAMAEILALAYHLPDDTPSHLKLGDMFARVNDPERAYSEFALVLRREPHNQTALQTAKLAAENDPTEPRLAYGERAQRIRSGFSHAVNSLSVCSANQPANGAPLDTISKKLTAFRPFLTMEKLRRSPDLVFAALDLIGEAESEMAKSCGPLQPLDRAWLLLAQKNRGDQ